MSKTKSKQPSEIELIKHIIQCADDKKADDPVALDLTGIDGPAAYFVICSGQSNPQLRAISESIIEGCKESFHMQPYGKDGSRESGWLILDYGSLLVHILATEQRVRYG
ncbi:MAG: ribosome silencing factor [Verrucomicrobiota bacterium]